MDGVTAVPMQRSRGRATVGLRLQDGRTVLQELHQSGSAKALLPRVHQADPEVVFLNTAGGLTGGDRLEYGLRLGPGCRATATTQTAERAYANAGGT
ncbi:MAG TPA: urease accessory protein UreD, partial [Paracoccaceae bacterium]